MVYLILLFSILFLFLAWRRLDWAVMFLIAALPAYLIRFNILGLPATLLEAMIWIVFIVWFLKNYGYIIENLKFKIVNCKLKIDNRYPFDWEIVLLLFIALLAASVAGFSNSSFGIWKAYFFEPALFFIVVLNVLYGDKGREKILWALAVSALAVSFLAIYQKITGQLIGNPVWAASQTRRVVSFFGYPNAVGLYLGPLILIFTGWLMHVMASVNEAISQSEKNHKLQAPSPKQITSTKPQTNYKHQAPNKEFVWKLGFGIWNLKAIFINLTIILSILSIYFAKSKGALLGITAGLIVFGFLAGKKIRWAMIALIIIMAIGLATYQPAWQKTFKYLTLNDFSGQVRRAQWRETWQMLKDGRLITGAGLANYRHSVALYHTEGIFFNKDNDPDFRRKIVLFNHEYKKKFWQPLEIYLYPHNIILNFWSELGLAGMLLFIWIIFKYFYLGIFNFQFSIFNEFSMNKFLIIGLISAMIAIIIHGLVDVPYFKNDLAVMFWLLVAMMSMINFEKKYF
ncbi:MAG: O-antigen ligase family protein [Parcubacteria group bacterium]|nr:O-antigen ligase family protein [Parcubacteria group bacterium]